MSSDSPDHVRAQQENYQQAVRNATNLLHSAVMNARDAVSESLQSDIPQSEIPTAHEGLIDDSLQNQKSVVEIVDNAFQQAKAILNDASMNFATSQVAGEVPQAAPAPQMPVLPGLPNTEMASQVLQSDETSSAHADEDLLAQNMKWMDASMLQLFESMKSQQQPAPQQSHVSEGDEP